ncbi:alpha/beta hydrolase [Kitasatospora sp. NBC_00315]|uniref:alpha/beta hydrolase n=1 Tax=Kitasatospora sp. NBC_00315 TaxID=2975963 RepID=UPI00352C96A9
MSRQAGRNGAAGHQALVWRFMPERPSAAVLLLHGGREHGLTRPGRWNLPGLRMYGFLRAIRQETAGADVAVGAVRYRHRGWNADRADAARDTAAALNDLAEELGHIPTVLVGHSMGGRAALRSAAHPNVTGVVALAPWCPEGEPCTQLSGRDVVMLHGDRDQVTAPAATRLFAARARAAGARVCGYTVAGSGHTLLRRSADWHRATARFCAGLLGLRELPADTAAALALSGEAPGGLGLPLPSYPRIRPGADRCAPPIRTGA